jgi:NAD(P)H-dependent flavin oxidoreductase YrpB (nitropropane dioxygenase family)
MSNALTNDLCRRLGIRLPIFGLAHRIEVAAAISRAGGLGVYAAARDGPHELQRSCASCANCAPTTRWAWTCCCPPACPNTTTA